MTNQKNTSFKTMLRNRTPLLIDLALKWCKAKDCWINYVYDKWVNIYVDKEQRYQAVRIVLGISGRDRNFDFNKTIDWDDLSEEETESWKSIQEWVEWFQNHATDIKREYEKIMNSYTRDECEIYLVDKFLNTYDADTAYKLIAYIIDSTI